MALRAIHTYDDVPVDELDLRDAIVGEGTALVPDGDSVRLYAVRGGRAQHIGTFHDAVAAWAALDAFDEAA